MIRSFPYARKGIISSVLACLLGTTAAVAQNPTSVDLDLVTGTTANTLDVMVRANGQGFSDVVSAFTFTLSWPSSSSATIGTAVQTCPGGYFFSPSAQVSNLGVNYLTYNAFGGATIAQACPAEAWPADTWHKVLTIPVTGITACTAFNVTNDAYTTPNNRNYFLSLGGNNKTGAIDATAVQLGNCAADCLGVIGGTALPGTSCDDGNSSTTNDTWSVNCVCSGTVPCTPPTAGSITSNSPICSGSSLTLSVSPTGTAPFTYSWSGTGTFSPNNTSQSVSVSGAASGTYSVTVTNGCGNSTANTSATVNSPANAGTNGTLTVCSNGSSTSLFTRLGGTPQAGGSWTGPSTVTGGNYDPATMNPGVYTYTVTGTSPCPNATATVTVTENTAPNAGTNSTLTICSNGAAVALINSLGGTPQGGGSWTGPSTVTGGMYNPATMNAGVYTYTVTGTSPCVNATATVTVTENTAPNAGTNGTLTICSNGAAVALINSLGGSPNAGGSWTAPGGAAHGANYDPAVDAPGVYTYTVTGTPPCANATATVTVTENAAANAGTNGTLTICSNGSAVALINSLGGSPQAGGSWTAPGGSAHGANYDPAADAPGVYTYTVTGTPPCANASATVTVTENTAANAGTNGTLTICSNGAAMALINSLGGSPQGGGSWTGPSTVIGGMYNPATMNAGVYTYTVTGTSPCVNASATVTVTENTAANAGTNGTLTVCSNGASAGLFAQLGGAPQAGGAWTFNSNPHSATYDPATDAPGVYTYTVVGTPPCANASATVTVTENAAANAGTNGTLNICSSGAATSLFAQLGGTPQAGGSWTFNSAPHSATYDPATDVAGVYTYTVTGTSPCANASATVTVTESASATWFADADGDGAGDPAVSQQSCTQPNGFVSNSNDLCPANPLKQAPGQCGCGNPDTDSDGDGTANCVDGCPNDPNKVAPGICGCGVADTDSDQDGIADCHDNCPNLAGVQGDQCNDNDPNTLNDVITANCVCAGVLPNDCEGVAGGPAQPGTSCDDGDACTTNDIYDGNCVCTGTFMDSDSDGICDANDNCPNLAGVQGDQCDDNDPNTVDDVITANCVCAGVLPNDCEGVAGGPAQPGTSCDDGDACTTNDIYDGNCVCTGTFTDSDSDGICDANDNCPNLAGVQGDQCDDNDPNTVDDVITANCVCAGVLPNDCEGVAGGPAQPGTSCDDGDVCTANDIYDGNCVCTGTFMDSDSDGICDANDNCPNLAGVQGDQCDDHDASTTNDVITADCVCAGTPLPEDCLGVPGGPALPGTACNDNDDCTINDLFDAGCVCTGTFEDTDSDGTCDASDGCPNDPNKIAPGECGCGVPDTDTDNDGLADCHDSCPNTPGEMGDACNDNDPNTTNDILNENCVCIGTTIVNCDNWTLTITTDGAGEETTWSITDTGTGATIDSGGPYADNVTVVETICMPPDPGCYQLTVLDAGGNGITGGGYVLRNANGDRVIDNAGNGAGFTTQSVAPESFCTPIGTDKLRFTDCDNEQRRPNDMIMANPNPLVSAQWQVGNQTDDGYEFWFFNPNGGYSRHINRSHSTSGGYSPADATRACKLGLASIAVNPLPQNTLLNVRVRGIVNSARLTFGPACRLRIDVAAAACPTTQLRNDPSSTFISCGATDLLRNGSSHITAAPVLRSTPTGQQVANRYQFRFVNAATQAEFSIVNVSYPLTITPQMPFQAGATYNVTVRASFDGGQTYCPYGAVCTISFRADGTGGRRYLADTEADAVQVELWPNPNREGVVYIKLSGLPDEDAQVDIDLYNTVGQRMHGEHTVKYGTSLNHAMDLRGDLPAGLYLVNITVGDRTFVRQLVVQ